MNLYSNYEAPNDYRSYLAHHGVKGMKWGVRHEQARKARIMKKYGISSKQYDEIRAKSMQRHKKFDKVRGIYEGAGAVIGAATGVGRLIGQDQHLSSYGVSGKDRVIAASISAGKMAIRAAIGSVISSAEYAIGRSIVDNFMEGREFKKLKNGNTSRNVNTNRNINTNRNSSKGQTEREVLDDLLSSTSGMSEEERELLAELDRDYNRR